MHDRFPLLLVGLLILVGTFATVLIRGAARGSFADKLSSYRSEPDGARAVYLLAQQHRIPVGRVQQSLDLLAEQDNLALLAVEFAEKNDEPVEHSPWQPDWPDGGLNDLDFSEVADEERLHTGVNAIRATPVTPAEREALLEHIKKGHTLIYLPWGHGENPLLQAIDVALWPADKALGIRTLVPGQPTPYTAGVERVESKVQSYLGLPPGAVPLLVDEKLGEAVAAVVPYGQGEVIVIGAPELVMNRALNRADNAQLWLSLLKTVAATGTIGFDEFHHGFAAKRSIAEFASRYGLQFAVLQLLLGVCLWALALRRFGRPRLPFEEARVGSTDALFATSRLYREGRHYRHAAGEILKELSAEHATFASLSTHSEIDQITSTLILKGRADLAASLTEVRRSCDAVSTEADVQEVARLAAFGRRLLHLKKPLSPAPTHAQARPL